MIFVPYEGAQYTLLRKVARLSSVNIEVYPLFRLQEKKQKNICRSNLEMSPFGQFRNVTFLYQFPL